MWLFWMARGSGKSRAISTSNTRKITAKRKNRMENGSRALFLGSKPHSKGEAFSRSTRDREDRRIVRMIINEDTMVAKAKFREREVILESIKYIFELKVQRFKLSFLEGTSVARLLHI